MCMCVSVYELHVATFEHFCTRPDMTKYVRLITVFERVEWFDVLRVPLKCCMKVNGLLCYRLLAYSYVKQQDKPKEFLTIGS